MPSPFRGVHCGSSSVGDANDQRSIRQFEVAMSIFAIVIVPLMLGARN
jgi:hypothetical protein